MSRRVVLRVGAGVSAGVLATGVAVLATLGYGGRDSGGAPPAAAPPKTAPVTRMTLQDTVRLTGKVGYGAAVAFGGRLPGTLTALAAPGTVLQRGGVAYRVDNEPVVVLLGDLPAYRVLAVGVTGPDVKQFEENLRALGYRGFTADTKFDGSTAVAVKQWQKKLGVTETGFVELGRIVYVAAPVRVAEQKQRPGDQAGPGAPVLTVTGTGRTVGVEIDEKRAALAKTGTKVQVRTAAGGTVEGVVAAAEPVPDSAPRRIAVTVTVTDQAALGDAESVDVVIVRAQKQDVLTVPVVALLAVGDGYGLEVSTGGARRIVPVTVGLFAQGRVEVSAPGLTEGTLVGVAAQ